LYGLGRIRAGSLNLVGALAAVALQILVIVFSQAEKAEHTVTVGTGLFTDVQVLLAGKGCFLAGGGVQVKAEADRGGSVCLDSFFFFLSGVSAFFRLPV